MPTEKEKKSAKHQALRAIAGWRMACKEEGTCITKRPEIRRHRQGWNAVWILIHRIRDGYYD